ncbi:MAG: class I SAM-dependent methyltransferase [Bryobacterales bacterium]|nr:class I SAM-dependent methyltransferase [Bryobacterales bacterium]
MNAPGVEQLAPLSEMFARVLTATTPESVGILGVAGGNGLEAIDSRVTRRVVGVDVHPEYLEAVARRHAGLAGLELHCLDLASERICWSPVDVVHVALVLEHAGTDLCLDNAADWVAAGGWLSVVLQLPSTLEQGVSTTGFASLQTLKDRFQLIEPTWLKATLAERGFCLETEHCLPLPAGKGFWHGVFRKPGRV